jgi:hypothetical protein
MSPDKHAQITSDEMLNDIRFVNQLAQEEIRRIDTRIRQRIAEENPDEKFTESLLDEVANQLGQLSSKVKLTEKAILTLQTKQIVHSEQRPDKKPSTAKVQITSKHEPSDLKFEAYQLPGFQAHRHSGISNFSQVETSSTGINYCWSGEDPNIHLAIPVDRSKALGMQIRLFALIKPEYSKQMKILIDGEHVKHRFAPEGQLYVVSCILGPSEKTGLTEINITLPGTHSPRDLDTGLDERKLGIAIREIQFGKPESMLVHTFKRLRLIK